MTGDGYLDDLRVRAEQRMTEHDTAPGSAGTSEDAQRLLNELSVHQVELELQNEELQRVRAELEASNRRYTELYDFAPIGYLSLDGTGTITLVNLHVADMLGVDRGALAGRSFDSFVAYDERPQLHEWLDRVRRGERVEPLTIRLVGGQGDGPHMITRLEAAMAPSGDECRIVLVDVTVQRRDEAERRAAQLLQQEQIFERFADPTLLLDVDDDGQYRASSVNEAFTTWVGAPRERLLGRSISEWIPPASAKRMREHFARAVSTGKASSFEDVADPGSGGERIAQVTAVPIVSQDGSCHQLLCSFRDITDERRARVQLEEERRMHLERLATLERFQSLTVGRELRMVELKRQLAALTGEVSEEQGRAYRRRSASQPPDVQQLEDVQLALLNILDDLQSVERLRELDSLKARFIAFASHELRTPLTSIHGFSSTLVERWDEFDAAQRREFVTIIDQQADRMRRLIDDLLVMSRINSGALQVEPQVVDVAEVIASVVADHPRGGIRTTGVRPAAAYVDPRHLRQALSNYITNAIKYGAPPIDIEVHADDDWVNVSVADRGPGVQSDFLPHLFEEFARAEEHAASQKSGSGLGLAIVRQLMAAQDAEAWYEPVDPTGSRFGLRLPIVK